jgi:SAM-dependent methyltransferase
MMTRQLKTLAGSVAPAPLRHAWGQVYGALKVRRARKAFDRSAGTAGGSFLPHDAIAALIHEGYRPPDPIRYDPDGLLARAREKVAAMSQVVDWSLVRTAVELGCWDGMIAALLRERGIVAYGLDITMAGADPRAARAGAAFVRSDAESIALASGTMDLVYSFASFEHFAHPDRCVAEIARILRPGGRAYLSFGPLYFSPYGRHAYRQIPIPYCHLLFDEDALHQWAETNRLPHDWPFVNGWSLRRYRALWRSLPSGLEVVAYREHATGGVGTELVARHPQVFRSRVDDFDELLVAHVEVTLRRT